jgi:hypothetical protein
MFVINESDFQGYESTITTSDTLLGATMRALAQLWAWAEVDTDVMEVVQYEAKDGIRFVLVGSEGYWHHGVVVRLAQ